MLKQPFFSLERPTGTAPQWMKSRASGDLKD
jgi:hypothetical protein